MEGSWGRTLEGLGSGVVRQLGDFEDRIHSAAGAKSRIQGEFQRWLLRSWQDLRKFVLFAVGILP